MGKTIDEVGIGISGSGKSGPTMGWKQVSFSNSTVFTGTMANQIGNDERNHVTLLRTALSKLGLNPSRNRRSIWALSELDLPMERNS